MRKTAPSSGTVFLMRLLLIRHGQSRSLLQSSDEEVLPDDINVLTDEGRASSVRLGKYLSICFPEVVMFASPVARARETAVILSQLLRCDVNFDWRLSERQFGFPSGTTCAQSRIIQESSFTRPSYAPDTGESVIAHRNRVSEFLETVLQQPGSSNKAICLVAHGGTIEHVHGYLTGAPVEAMAKFFTNCGPANYHLWTSLIADDGRVVWRLDGVDLRA
jgi:2,3-bisphosphoglycerate-dependent phosphoglycerate mutase